jgi:hypothetical protein
MSEYDQLTGQVKTLEREVRRLRVGLDKIATPSGGVRVSSIDTDSLPDLTDYARLPGRTGGQLLKGGIGAGENLLLQSTAHATRGVVGIIDNAYALGYLRVGSASAPTNVTAGDFTAERLSLGNLPFINSVRLYASRADTAIAGDPQTVYIYQTNAPAGASNADRRALMVRNEYSGAQNEAGIVFGAGAGFYLTGTGDVEDGGGVYAIALAPRTGAGAAMGLVSRAMSVHALLFDAIGRAAAETVAVTNLWGLHVQLAQVGSTFLAGDAIATAAGIRIENMGDAHITNSIGLDIVAQSGAATLNFGIRNAGNMVQTGYMRVGAVTAPANVAAGDFTCVRLNVNNEAAFAVNNILLVQKTDFAVDGTVIPASIIVANTPSSGGGYEFRGLSLRADYRGAVNNTSTMYGARIEADVFGTGKMSYIVALGGIGLVARGASGAGGAMSAGDCRALDFALFGTAGSRAGAETIAVDVLTGVNIQSGYANFIAGDAVTTVYGINIAGLGNAKVTNTYGLNMALQTGSAMLNVGVKLDGGTTCAVWLNTDTPANGAILWGTSRDTNLYRSAADTLKTDDAFHAAGGLVADTVAELSAAVGVTVDACLIKDGRAALALGLRETGGPTDLIVGAIVDGEYLKRVGATIVSGAGGGGGGGDIAETWAIGGS